MDVETQPRIPESFFEHRHLFPEPWVDRWILPNPFISPLLKELRAGGVELSDFTFNKEVATAGDAHLNVTIRRLNAAVRIGLDTVTFIAVNPDWTEVPDLTLVFDRVSEIVCTVIGAKPVSQQAVLAFHVTEGAIDFHEKTASLINRNLVGEADFWGVSRRRDKQALIIDKSLKYERAAFVRLERTFPGSARFPEVASSLYEDEIVALSLLGIVGIP